MKNHLLDKIIALTVFFILIDPAVVFGDVKCIRATSILQNGQVITNLSRVTRLKKCKTGEVKLSDAFNIYGDGSGELKKISASETLEDPLVSYTNVEIDAGVTWTVPSGTVIRCKGNFTNNGTIIVQTGAFGGQANGADSSSNFIAYAQALSGVSARAAGSGEFGDGGDIRVGGYGGFGLSEYQASIIRYTGPFAGGAGAGGATQGGKGGGGLVVLCEGDIRNTGIIKADGGSSTLGAGGGGGGVIILASKKSVVSTADSSLLARGGNGANITIGSGPGGGGGGGIIHLMAPEVNATGATVSVDPGLAGLDTGISISLSVKFGGHGGGASGGSGGNGAAVSGTAISFPAFDGLEGHIIYSLIDPSPLF